MELSKFKRHKLQRFGKKLWAEFVKESEEWTAEEYVKWLIVKLYEGNEDDTARSSRRTSKSF